MNHQNNNSLWQQQIYHYPKNTLVLKQSKQNNLIKLQKQTDNNSEDVINISAIFNVDKNYYCFVKLFEAYKYQGQDVSAYVSTIQQLFQCLRKSDCQVLIRNSVGYLRAINIQNSKVLEIQLKDHHITSLNILQFQLECHKSECKSTQKQIQEAISQKLTKVTQKIHEQSSKNIQILQKQSIKLSSEQANNISNFSQQISAIRKEVGSLNKKNYDMFNTFNMEMAVIKDQVTNDFESRLLHHANQLELTIKTNQLALHNELDKIRSLLTGVVPKEQKIRINDKSPVYNNFQSENGIIQYISSDRKTGTQITFIDPLIRQPNKKLTMKIVSSKNHNILIGLIDKKYIDDANSFMLNRQQSIFFFCKNGKVYQSGLQTKYQMNENIKQGDKIAISVEYNRKQLNFIINDRSYLHYKSDKVDFQKDQFIPCIIMLVKGDKISIQ